LDRKPTPSADPVFQSPESDELDNTIEREALTHKRRQRREGCDDPVHDWTRMPALVLQQHGVAACAFDEAGDVGMNELAFEDQKFAFP